MASFIRVGHELINTDQIGNCVLLPDGQLRIWFVGNEDPAVFNHTFARALWAALTDGVPDRLAAYVAVHESRKGA